MGIKEKIQTLKEMVETGEISERDMFAVICVLYYGFYCELGREGEFLKKQNKLEYLEVFKELNQSIHSSTVEDIIAELLSRDVMVQ